MSKKRLIMAIVVLFTCFTTSWCQDTLRVERIEFEFDENGAFMDENPVFEEVDSIGQDEQCEAEMDEVFQEGRRWTIISRVFLNPTIGRDIYCTSGYRYIGKELVDGLLCSVLSYYSIYDVGNPFGVDEDVLYSEDNNRSTSYIYYMNGSRYYQHILDKGWVDELLYDFSLNKGDTIHLYPLDPNTIVIGDLSSLVTEAGDTVLEESSDKRVRKWLRIVDYAEGGGDEDIWIEGIGSLRNGPLGSRFGYAGVCNVLFKCFDDENIYYFNKDIPWYKEFASSIRQIDEDSDAHTNKANIEIFDLTGKKVETETPGQIYISNGKKYLSK